MFFIVLDETDDKLETIIDFDEIISFNERKIVFKNTMFLDSCKEWYNQLKQLKKWRRPNEKGNAGKKI